MADLFNIMYRCSLLLQKIEKADYPSKKDLKRYLEQNGEERSDRTVDRAFLSLREQFGIEITYDPVKNGYYIDQANSLDSAALYRFLELGKTLDLLKTSASQPRKTFKAIHFQEQGQFKGLEYLQPALEAIINHKKVRFYHRSFNKEHPLEYIVQPYLLKEYENRWYIVCIPDHLEELRFFGVDRIQHLEVLNDQFNPDPDIEPSGIFEDRIGISSPDAEMQTIELSCDPGQGNYLKTLPLHPSQQIIKDDDKELRLQIHVEPNFELNRKILSLTDCITVTYPEWLAQQIKECLEKAVAKY